MLQIKLLLCFDSSLTILLVSVEIQEFSFDTWILREINICESKMSKTFILTILETLHVDFSEIVTFFIDEIYKNQSFDKFRISKNFVISLKSKCRVSYIFTLTLSDIFDSLKLISRKI